MSFIVLPANHIREPESWRGGGAGAANHAVELFADLAEHDDRLRTVIDDERDRRRFASPDAPAILITATTSVVACELQILPLRGSGSLFSL
jgi:hypothetical protein